MNKYINTFASSGDYETYKASSALSTPNVAYIEDSKEVKWLNSKKDLYNIYGTLRSSTGKIKINNTDYSFSATGDDNSFGLMYSQPVSRLFIYQKERFVSFEKIDIDTSLMTNFSELFSGCQYLTSVDLSHFNTSSATSFDYMFSSCGSITSLDVSNFNTSAVTNMLRMFKNCKALTSLEVSKWNTSAVTNMNQMFFECNALTSLNLSNWDTSAVTNTSQMFINCGRLTTVTMNNTSTTTFDKIKTQLVTDSVASHVTIIRDGVNWKYQNGAWVEA